METILQRESDRGDQTKELKIKIQVCIAFCLHYIGGCWAAAGCIGRESRIEESFGR